MAKPKEDATKKVANVTTQAVKGAAKKTTAAVKEVKGAAKKTTAAVKKAATKATK